MHLIFLPNFWQNIPQILGMEIIKNIRYNLRLDEMFPLDVRFFNLPAQAIEVSLAGIEPPCNEFDTVLWTREAIKYDKS